MLYCSLEKADSALSIWPEPARGIAQSCGQFWTRRRTCQWQRWRSKLTNLEHENFEAKLGSFELAGLLSSIQDNCKNQNNWLWNKNSYILQQPVKSGLLRTRGCLKLEGINSLLIFYFWNFLAQPLKVHLLETAEYTLSSSKSRMVRNLSDFRWNQPFWTDFWVSSPPSSTSKVCWPSFCFWFALALIFARLLLHSSTATRPGKFRTPSEFFQPQAHAKFQFSTDFEAYSGNALGSENERVPTWPFAASPCRWVCSFGAKCSSW